MSAKRMLILVCAALQLASPAFVFAADSPAPKDDLGRMELRFFDKTYDKDSQEERLTRLEKLVFGEANTGSDAERMQKLRESVATSDSAITDAANEHSSNGGAPAAESPPRPTDSATASGGRSNDFDNTSTGGAGKADDEAAAPDAGTDYPAVDALESKLLGHINGERPLRARLAELERKAFGRVSTNPDLSERVVALQRFSKSGQQPSDATGRDDVDERGDTTAGGIVPFNNNMYSKSMDEGLTGDRFDTQQPPANDSYRSGDIAPRGLNNRVSALEKQIFGKSSKAPLPERLTKLEDAVFGDKEDRHQGSVIERTVRLSNTVSGADDQQQQTAAKPPARHVFNSGTTTNQDLNDVANDPVLGSAIGSTNTTDNQTAAQPKTQHPLLHGLGKALGAAGLGAAALLGSMGSGVIMGGSMMGMGGYGMPYGGMGMGMGMPYGGMYSSPYGGMYSSPYGMGMGMGGLGGFGAMPYGMGLGGMSSFGGLGMGMPFGF